MKREILFKAKRVDNGEWVNGCLVNNLWYYSENSEFKKGTGVCEIITGKYDGDCWEDISTDENCIVTVNPETICQFTGLLDKNGKKIFEGDVLTKNQYPFQCSGIRNYDAIVEWVYSAWEGVYKLVAKDKRGISDGVNFRLDAGFDNGLTDYEIISNIHD